MSWIDTMGRRVRSAAVHRAAEGARAARGRDRVGAKPGAQAGPRAALRGVRGYDRQAEAVRPPRLPLPNATRHGTGETIAPRRPDARPVEAPKGEKSKAPEVVGVLQDTLDVAERVTKTMAYRSFNWVSGVRGKNRSGNFRGMTKSKNLANLGKAMKVANVAMGLPGAINEAKQALKEVDALSKQTDMGVAESTLRFGAIIIDHGSNAAAELMGLQEANKDVREVMKKVDEISSDPNTGVIEKTWEFGKTITKGGLKTFLDIVPFCGGLADKIDI